MKTIRDVILANIVVGLTRSLISNIWQTLYLGKDVFICIGSVVAPQCLDVAFYFPDEQKITNFPNPHHITTQNFKPLSFSALNGNLQPIPTPSMCCRLNWGLPHLVLRLPATCLNSIVDLFIYFLCCVTLCVVKLTTYKRQKCILFAAEMPLVFSCWVKDAVDGGIRLIGRAKSLTFVPS